MLRQIQYFQAVVRNNSFSKAAEECYISQSAISQQIQALERELGFSLLVRKNRKFLLTPAGEYFYKKSLVLTADFERICIEGTKIAKGNRNRLRLGYLKSYSGGEFQIALDKFSTEYPEVDLEIEGGNHEELYHALLSGRLDLALNDQRRAFSQGFTNIFLIKSQRSVEISSRSSLAQLTSVTSEDLKNTPCILISSEEQQNTELEYYRDVVGFQGDFLFADNLEEARLMIVSNKGFMPVDIIGDNANIGVSITRIPLYQNGEPATHNYCAFWKKERTNFYIEEFAKLLKEQFV